MADKKSVFAVLSSINCNEHTEKKNGLTYLSWAWAWAEVKKNFPEAFYTIYENANGLFYHTDGNTCWVKTGVTIESVEHIEYLPVMDFRNQSIPLAKVTSFDVNKAIQRSLTKACARHGLGLYIYAGEDLPEEDAAPQAPAAKKPAAPTTPKAAAPKAETDEDKFKNAVKYLVDKLDLKQEPSTPQEVSALWTEHADLQADPVFKAAISRVGSTLKSKAA